MRLRAFCAIMQNKTDSSHADRPFFLWPPSAAFAGGFFRANQKLPAHQYLRSFLSGGATRNRTGDEGFADLCLTAWLWRHIPLLCSGVPRYAFAFDIHWKTGEMPVFQWSGKRGSNPPPQPWQGCALPNELFPQLPFSVLPEKSWCGRRDLNSYACRHQNRNLARLPIPPRPHARQRIFGDPSEIRTPDTLIKSQVLYRLS